MSPVRVRQLSYTVILRSRSMSSKTAMRSFPATVMRRILCGASHDRCMCAIFPEGERTARELVVRRHGRGDHDSLDRVVCEHLVDARRHPRGRVALRELCMLAVVDVAEPGQVSEAGEVAGEVLAPLPDADLSEASHP